MFTGIVEKIGVVRELKKNSKRRTRTLVLDVRGGLSRTLGIGGSVAVNGACLTLVRKKAGTLSFELVAETLRRTTLRDLKPGDRVHLELPLKGNSRLDGHFVLGHVDGVGEVLRVKRSDGEMSLLVSPPKPLRPFFLEKGSIAVDGVSLTVGRVSARSFWLHLIPHTLKKTCFGGLKAGDRVNLEADILVKLLSKMFRRPLNGLTTPRAQVKL